MSKVKERAQNFSTEWLRAQTLYKESAKAVGLTDNFITILHAIYNNPENCTQKYLVETTYLPKQTINFVISRLQKQKLITMKASPKDGRIKLIQLTKSGKAYLSKTIVPFIQDTEQALAQMTKKDQKRLVKLFKNYNNNLEQLLSQNILSKKQ